MTFPVRTNGSMHVNGSARHLDRVFSVRQHRRGVHVKSSPNPVLEYFSKVVVGRKVVTFRERAEWWLDWLQTRNNDPIPETSVPSIRSALDKWLIPNLGDLPLSEVGNGALKNLVCKMKGHLSPKSQHTYVGYAKEVRKSLVDDEGDVILPNYVEQRVYRTSKSQ